MTYTHVAGRIIERLKTRAEAAEARVAELEAELKIARCTIQKQHIMISAIERALEGDP